MEIKQPKFYINEKVSYYMYLGLKFDWKISKSLLFTERVLLAPLGRGEQLIAAEVAEIARGGHGRGRDRQGG